MRRAHSRYKEKGGKGGFIDLLWRGTLIAEHKSLGRDLDSAYKQALDKAVDVAYAGAGFKSAPTKSDVEGVAFLFELYHMYTSMLPAPEAPKRRKKK